MNAGDAQRQVVAVSVPGIQSGKVVRIAAMAQQLLEELHAAPLDATGKARLRDIYGTSLRELSAALSPELRSELRRITLPWDEAADVPSDAELRVAQAQLVGWLEGLYHGIQAAVVAAELSAQAAAEQGAAAAESSRPQTAYL